MGGSSARDHHHSHIIIYGLYVKLIGQDDGKDKSDFGFLYKRMNDEIQKEWKERTRG
jgi:hypothetical protein